MKKAKTERQHGVWKSPAGIDDSIIGIHAFRGSAPKEAYFVKSDIETTTLVDINRGIVNILVGFAPLKPAEFIILTIKQSAGYSDTS